MDSSNSITNICGIYAIYSAINDTIYVGYSSDIPARWYDHRWHLHRGDHDNPHLQRAWDKYGEESFVFFIIEECSVEMLHIQEQFHLDKYPRHYNLGDCAASPRRGVPHSEESKKKMSEVKMGNQNAAGTVHTSETRERIRQSKTGLKASDETKDKMSASHKGRVFTSEHKANISASMMGKTNGAGRVVSQESKEKTSASMKAYWARKREAEAASDGGSTDEVAVVD